MVALSSLIGVSSAHAELNRLLTSGIVYPTAADSVAKNPSALLDERGDSVVARMAYKDPAAGYAGMLASTGGDSTATGFALNALGAGMLTLGGGWGGRTIRIGANLSVKDLSVSDGAIGVGLVVGGTAGLRFAVTASSITKDDDTLTFGIGYANPQVYQLEFDLGGPAKGLTAAGKPLTQTAMAVKYFQSFGLGIFETSPAGLKQAGLGTLDYGGVLQVRVSGKTSVDLRYATEDGGTFGFGFLSKF